MKKLFSYLLISSMVVLSSCTNYDDQFDDLNTQINTLKTQIEGFSSLSSGLTALQGTVASLQTAIANIPVTPATDVSGLATAANLEALDTALTALAAEVDALTASLANAATSAEVSALNTALDNVKEDLADLLASNNIFTPQGSTLTVGTQAQLTFATALGDKVAIINGNIDIDQTASMDATELATLMAKFTSVTGNVDFTATATGITQVDGFTSLTGAANVVLDVSGPISLPVLETAAVVTITDNSKTTSFSAPKLSSVSSFASNALTLSKATSIDLSSLVRYGAVLTITQKSGLVNLDALGNTPASGTVETTNALTLVGATSFALSARTAGTITANDVTAAISLPLWKGTTASSFDKASEVVLPKITGGVAIDLSAMAPKATKFHYIGTGLAASSTVTNYPTFTTGAANTNLETLIIDGTSTSVNISDATDLTSLTFTGAANVVTLNDLNSMTDITLGYVSKIGSYSSGSLTVTDNDDLETITADSLDDISGLTITGNTNLNTLSFAALNSIGTSATGTAITATTLAITNNDLSASNIQIASETNAVTAVAGSITTDSGLTALKTYLDAMAAKDTDAHVEFDNVTAITLANGTTPASYTGAASTKGYGIVWNGEDDNVDLINKTPSSTTTALVTARLQKATGSLSTTYVRANDGIEVEVNGVTKIAALTAGFTNGISGYDVSDPSTYMTALETELNSQFDDASMPFNVTIENDFAKSFTYDLDVFAGGVSSPTTLLSETNGYVDFDFNGVHATAQVTGMASRATSNVVEAVRAAIQGSASTRTFNVERTGNTLVATPLLTGTAITDVFFSGSAPALSFDGYEATLSLTRALTASHTISVKSVVASTGWRITVENESVTIKASELESDGTPFGGNLSGTTRLIQSQIGTTGISNTAVLVAFENVRAGSLAVIDAAETVSFTSWL